MAALAAIRVGSLVHRLWLGTSSKQAIHALFWGELMACAGAYINVQRVPERWFPSRDRRSRGAFDYVGNSHSIMHLLAVASMAQVYRAVWFESQLVRAEVPCL